MIDPHTITLHVETIWPVSLSRGMASPVPVFPLVFMRVVVQD